MEEIGPNVSPPMCVNVSERRGCLCVERRGRLKEVILAHLPTAVSGGERLEYSMHSHQRSEISVTVMCYCSSVSLTITYLYYLTFHVLQIRITASQEQW